MTSGMKFFFGLAIVMLGIAMGLIVFSLWGPTPTSQPVEVNGVRTFTPGQGAVKPKKNEVVEAGVCLPNPLHLVK